MYGDLPIMVFVEVLKFKLIKTKKLGRRKQMATQRV